MASYDSEKSNIIQIQNQLIKEIDGKKISIDQVKASFNDHLVNRPIPHWYGTKWSFGGHTAIP